MGYSPWDCTNTTEVTEHTQDRKGTATWKTTGYDLGKLKALRLQTQKEAHLPGMELRETPTRAQET